jgi:hypothetical protein
MAATAVRFDFHCLSLPLAGVREPTDVVLAIPTRSGLLAVIVDPVGQGQKALAAGRKGAAVVRQTPGADLVDLFGRMHRAVEAIDGVSLGAARIDAIVGRVEFASVGKVYGAIVGPKGLRLLTPEQGTVGVGLPKSPAVSEAPWSPGDLLLLAADGLVDAWDLTKVRGGIKDPFEAIARRVGGYSARLPEEASLVLARERL